MHPQARDSVGLNLIHDSALAEAYGGPDLPHADAIYECLRRGLEKNPDGVAIISVHQAKDYLASTISSKGPDRVDCLHWTFRQLNEASLKLATFLAPLCPPGRRRISCFVWNSIEHALLCWATAHLRGVFAPLDPGFLEPGREERRAFYLSTVKPDVVLALRPDAGLDRQLSADVVKISVADGPMPDSWLSLSSILRSTSVDSPTATISHDNPPDPHAHVQIFFTSGTTALPKAVAHSAAKLTPVLLKVARVTPVGLMQMATLSNFRPIYMTYLLSVHQAGGTILIPAPSFTPATTIAAALKYQPKMTLFMPAQLRRMVAEGSGVGVVLDSLRAVFLSGDQITTELLEMGSKTFPAAIFRGIMGMTEVYGLTNYGALPNPIPSLPNGILTMGPPNDGCIVRICAPGDARPLKRSEPGELWVAGQSVLDSYVDNRDPDHFRDGPDLNGKNRRWFFTGDLAMVDDRDHIYVLGRYKDIIVRAGLNLSPIAIETVLAQQGFADAYVIGVPHEVLGTVPAAIVRHLDGVDPARLADDVARALGDEYRLEYIWELRDLGLQDWIYNSNSKVSKSDLQQRVHETVLRKSSGKPSL